MHVNNCSVILYIFNLPVNKRMEKEGGSYDSEDDNDLPL